MSNHVHLLIKEGKKSFERYMRESNEHKCLEYEEKIKLMNKELHKIIEEKYGVSVPMAANNCTIQHL